jgi:preprotein translocase subunit SecA
VISGQRPDDRRAAYACDVTYCTDKELAFDYLRDRLAAGQHGNRAQRHIERLAQQGSARRLTMRGLFYAIVDEADSVLVDGARTPLVIANRGEQSAQRATLEAALHVARSFAHGVHFSLNPRERRVELLPAGQAKLATSGENFQAAVRGPRRGEALVAQALAALHVYERDKHYLVRDDRVQIIDESTGRILPGRSWEQGLHQMIEAKEGCTITDEQSAIARITYQRFFRRYLRLAGMTGTAREVSGELWSVYRLPVVRVPTSRPLARRDLGTHVVANAREKWRAIAERTRALHAEGRPVLIGTRSVEASEQLSAVLNASGLAHDLLNARQDGHEAQIIARAGERGRITVATNMAGRGTDVRLGAGVADVGGLHVIATELHEASRIDRQLHGRCGRQGDPGSFETLVALDDDLVRSFMGTAGRICVRILTRTGARRLNRIPLRWAQARAERYYASVRRELRETDDRLQDALAFAGRRE